jgi:hypothetical protein
VTVAKFPLMTDRMKSLSARLAGAFIASAVPAVIDATLEFLNVPAI